MSSTTFGMDKMNNSYNYSGFIELLSTNDLQHEDTREINTLQCRVEPVQNHRDEIIDNFIFSSALTDINYTD